MHYTFSSLERSEILPKLSRSPTLGYSLQDKECIQKKHNSSYCVEYNGDDQKDLQTGRYQETNAQEEEERCCDRE